MTHSHAGQSANRLVFISACEQSADEHASRLIRAVMEKNPRIRFFGIAGPKMREAGCHGLFDMTQHSAMLLGALGAVGKAIRVLRLADRSMRRFRCNAAVLIDSPTLHIPMISRAKSAGVPVLYYIAPQLWAWGARRIHKLRDRVDHLACILPFEEKYFREQGVRATFVGHPLSDKLAERTVGAAALERLRSIGQPLVAILPGSRMHIVEENLPGQLEVASAIRRAFPNAAFVVSRANDRVSGVVEMMAQRSQVPVSFHDGALADLATASDLALATSGTTTLELAMHGCPMIVMYNTSRWGYELIGRWLIRTPFLSLPNILASREVVPEFMPYYRSTAPIASKAIEMLADDAVRNQMRHELLTITSALRNMPASKRVAELLMQMMK